MISAASRPTWVRAESSIPITTIAVMITIQSTPTAVTAAVDRRRPVQPKSSKRVEAGDLGQVRHHDDVGDDDRPAGDPAELRAHRLGHPGEAGAAVRVGFVHVVVAAGDQEHRDEADQQDRRRLQGDRGGDEAEGRGEAVAGGGGGDADDDAGDEADRVLLQPLVFDSGGRARGTPADPGREPMRSPIRLLSAAPIPAALPTDGKPTEPSAQVGECPKCTALSCTILYKQLESDLTQ